MKKILFLILFLTGITPVFKNNSLNLGCSQAYAQDNTNGEESVQICSGSTTTTAQEGDWLVTDTCSLVPGEKPWDPCENECIQTCVYNPVGHGTGDGSDDGTGGTGGGGTGGGGTGGGGSTGGTTTPIKVGEAPITKTEFDKRSADYKDILYKSVAKENQVLTLSTGAKVMGTLTRFENEGGHIFYYFTPYSTGYDYIVGMYYKIPDKDPRLPTASSSNSITSTFSNGSDGFPESGTSIISNLLDLFGRPITVTIEPNNSPITVINDVPLTMETWYLDKDRDGYHSDTRQATTAPSSQWKATTKGPDCNDNSYYKNTDCRPDWYLDEDRDGYDGGTTQSDTSPGPGYVLGISLGRDCNDFFPSIQNDCGDGGCYTSVKDLRAMFPTLTDTKARELTILLNKYAKKFGIDTKEKLQHFLAQAGHESAGFTKLKITEGTNYSTPEGLVKTWPKRFSFTNPKLKNPNDYYGPTNKSKLFDFVYGSRMGNGGIPGNALLYRGRGIIQITGKSNYIEFDAFYRINVENGKDFVLHPELMVSTNNLAVLSSMWWFKKNVLDVVNISNNTSVADITLIVNNGYNGLPDRETNFTSAKQNIKCN